MSWFCWAKYNCACVCVCVRVCVCMRALGVKSDEESSAKTAHEGDPRPASHSHPDPCTLLPLGKQQQAPQH